MTIIKVKGLACGGCASAIKRAIALVAPDLHVHVDVAAQSVQVPEGADQAVIMKAINDAGYDVLA